ncbi:hypothetical protein [Citrobacter sp. Cy070]|uniref:hypothetical protein n=1 Tax=Citrobacter sp. Cy070 TaxID=2985161 RepID=UPI00257889B0|nr:hypothetical protein [Citrobacter sp. Cy070]MDM2731630.1 hypothetical protein [Citrobacter sp. Cy070]
MMNPVPWLQMTNMISYQGLVRTFPKAMETIIDILPKEKKYALYREAGEEIKTEKMAESAEKGVWDTIKEWTGEAWDNVKDVVVEVVAATVVAAGKKILSKLKFW